MTSTLETGIQSKSWHRCCLCKGHTFKSPAEFCRHLRDYHCSKEGGSFMCKYGANNICPSLPLEGVSDRDYENHIVKDHVHMKRRTGMLFVIFIINMFFYLVVHLVKCVVYQLWLCMETDVSINQD